MASEIRRDAVADSGQRAVGGHREHVRGDPAVAEVHVEMQRRLQVRVSRDVHQVVEPDHRLRVVGRGVAALRRLRPQRELVPGIRREAGLQVRD